MRQEYTMFPDNIGYFQLDNAGDLSWYKYGGRAFGKLEGYS